MACDLCGERNRRYDTFCPTMCYNLRIETRINITTTSGVARISLRGDPGPEKGPNEPKGALIVF